MGYTTLSKNLLILLNLEQPIAGRKGVIFALNILEDMPELLIDPSRSILTGCYQSLKEFLREREVRIGR